MTARQELLPGFVPSAPLTATKAAPLAASHVCTRFAGNAVVAPSSAPPSRVYTPPTMGKKGRLNKMMPQQQQRQRQNVELPEDGTPIFAVFVRTTRAKIWYPLGAVQGDDRSKDMVKGLSGGMMRGMYENALDKGIAQTVYGRDKERFYGNAVRMYPQLKKYVKDLEFGYKVSAKGLDDQSIKVVTQEMAMTFFQWAKKKVDDTMQGSSEPSK